VLPRAAGGVPDGESSVHTCPRADCTSVRIANTQALGTIRVLIERILQVIT
jgi:hypothetical protein